MKSKIVITSNIVLQILSILMVIFMFIYGCILIRNQDSVSIGTWLGILLMILFSCIVITYRIIITAEGICSCHVVPFSGQKLKINNTQFWSWSECIIVKDFSGKLLGGVGILRKNKENVSIPFINSLYISKYKKACAYIYRFAKSKARFEDGSLEYLEVMSENLND